MPPEISHAPTASTPSGFQYPCVDPGIPALAVDAVLNAHQDMIDRIKLCYSIDRTTFDQSVIPLLRRYAAYVHLLPCTADNYFSALGGLLHIGLQTAFYALQGTDAYIFSGRATISERRNLEPRWRHATFIAGLCNELHRVLSHLIITDQAGNEWPPYLIPLADWLAQGNIERYYLKWRPNAHENRALSLFAIQHVVSPAELQDLATGNSQIVPHMLATITGMPVFRDHNILEALVRRSLALVIDRHLQENAERYGKPQLGSHLERYLVDALRRLVTANASWTPNAEKSRVWYGSDGMFIVWPAAADDIRKLLDTDQLPGIPKAPETILELLLAAGVLIPQDSGRATWPLYPPNSKTAVEAVKVASPAVLFAGTDSLPEALPLSLLRPVKPVVVPPEIKPSCATPTQPVTGFPVAVTPVTVVPHAPKTEDPNTIAPPSPDTPQDEAPKQLSLLPALTATTVTAPPSIPFEAPPSEAPRPPDSPPEKPALIAPLRLPLAVRNALQSIIATLTTGSDGAAVAMADGLFVPLASFKKFKMEPAAALRALAETGMLAQNKAVTRAFQGQETVGALLALRHVKGLPPERSHAEGRQHAGSRL
jgi:conjugal transfer pilus assembly protein TraI